MTDVGAFLLAQPLDAPWNCSTEAADWCVALGYPDFAAAWRETLDSDACEAENNSLLEHWRAGIGNGLRAAFEPYQAGDIAVVTVGGYAGGAIFTGERWAIRTKRGHAFLSPSHAAVAAAWRP